MKRILIFLIVILFIITGCALGKHTVVFNSAGGSLIDSQTIENGKKVTKPVSPTRSGYSFVGWESDGVSYNFDDEVPRYFSASFIMAAKRVSSRASAGMS